jgi:hypothetical protein
MVKHQWEAVATADFVATRYMLLTAVYVAHRLLFSYCIFTCVVSQLDLVRLPSFVVNASFSSVFPYSFEYHFILRYFRFAENEFTELFGKIQIHNGIQQHGQT